MSEVRFVGLVASTPELARVELCRLIESEVQSGARIAVLAHDEAQARALDGLLWTFDAYSFIPHALLTDDPTPYDAVLIVPPGAAVPAAPVYVNLREEALLREALPRGLDRPTVIEPYSRGSERRKAAAQRKWEAYRQQGMAVEPLKE